MPVQSLQSARNHTAPCVSFNFFLYRQCRHPTNQVTKCALERRLSVYFCSFFDPLQHTRKYFYSASLWQYFYVTTAFPLHFHIGSHIVRLKHKYVLSDLFARLKPTHILSSVISCVCMLLLWYPPQLLSIDKKQFWCHSADSGDDLHAHAVPALFVWSLCKRESRETSKT